MRISDWSSDVCSSDLRAGKDALEFHLGSHRVEYVVAKSCTPWARQDSERLSCSAGRRAKRLPIPPTTPTTSAPTTSAGFQSRSAGLRVWKEWVGRSRSRWTPHHQQKKNQKHKN